MTQNYVLIRIQELLDERNWSLYKLAKASNIPYSSLNSLFQKNNQPTISTLEKICSGFHITLAQFFSKNTSDPIYDFTNQELEVLYKIRKLNKRDKYLLMTLLDNMNQK